MPMQLQSDSPALCEGYIPLGAAAFYYRDIGQRQPIVILHGGPDAAHRATEDGADR
jgi:hypothetical protein